MKQVITRFAPSPTGYLHIGGARTALFNYLYARAMGGKFLLRIEDTDLERSTSDAVDAILNGLDWLGLQSDEPPVFQMQNQKRHIEVAEDLLSKGLAYKCYCTKEELEQRRTIAEQEGHVYQYDGRCRNLAENNIPQGISPAVRIKVNKEGSTVIKDMVMGEISIANALLDDLIILRSDQVPTYMFAVVVDDHDMEITHIIRGDDHLTNAFRQYQIYKACGWEIPEFAHLPLIHSADGQKMSKRYGAVAVENYRDMGFLPSAIKNYLLKLGWSHGDDEIITMEQAIEWFNIIDVNKSPARFDVQKLSSINFHYLKASTNEELLNLMMPFINALDGELHSNYKSYLLNGLTPIKDRSKTIKELVDNSWFYILKPPYILSDDAQLVLTNNSIILEEQIVILEALENFNRESIHDAIKEHATAKEIKLGKAVEALRVKLVGKTVSPASVFDIMDILGKDESFKRLQG